MFMQTFLLSGMDCVSVSFTQPMVNMQHTESTDMTVPLSFITPWFCSCMIQQQKPYPNYSIILTTDFVGWQQSEIVCLPFSSSWKCIAILRAPVNILEIPSQMLFTQFFFRSFGKLTPGQICQVRFDALYCVKQMWKPCFWNQVIISSWKKIMFWEEQGDVSLDVLKYVLSLCLWEQGPIS